MTGQSPETEKRYHTAVAEAHREALAHDDDTVLFGQDVTMSITGLTTGLVGEFGAERVRDTPISEQAVHGIAIGAAMADKRPIVEHEVNTMAYLAMDQLVNNANKLRYMTGGQVSVPITISIAASGASGGFAAQHSDNVWPMLINAGVKTVVPTTPYDAKGLFHAAVAENDPVAIFFPAQLHQRRGEVPDDRYVIPLGTADVKRHGDDVTVIAIGETVPDAMEVATSLSDSVSVEVVDPRTLLPLDEATMVESVRKTGRVVVADGASRTCGVAAEIAARLANACMDSIVAPVKRVTRAGVTVSYNPREEQAILPDSETIERAILDLVH